MLHVPRALILHQRPLPLLEHLGHQRRHVGFGPKLFDGREEGFEIEDDGAAQGQAAQRLPVDAEVDAGEGKVGDLEGAEVLVGVAGGHEEGLVDFETPGAALDGLVRGQVGEESVGVALSVRCRVRGDREGDRTGPWRIPSWLCSRGLVCGSP